MKYQYINSLHQYLNSHVLFGHTAPEVHPGFPELRSPRLAPTQCLEAAMGLHGNLPKFMAYKVYKW